MATSVRWPRRRCGADRWCTVRTSNPRTNEVTWTFARVSDEMAGYHSSNSNKASSNYGYSNGNYGEECAERGHSSGDGADCDNEKSVDEVDDGGRHERRLGREADDEEEEDDDDDDLEDEYDDDDDDDENGFASMKIFHGPDPVIDTTRVEKIPAKEPKFFAVPLKSALKKPSTPTQEQGGSTPPASVR